MIETITQTVSAGNRLDAADLPTTTASIDERHATYASSSQGGLFVFSSADGGVPKDGDTYTVRNAETVKLHSVVGNVGDATALDLYAGPVGSMTKVASLTLSVAPVGGNELFWDLRAYKIARTWAVGITDSGGGTTLQRTVTFFREV